MLIFLRHLCSDQHYIFMYQLTIRASFLHPKRYAVSIRWEREQERLRQELESSTADPVTNKKPCITYTIEDFHRYFCCCARRVGSFFFLLERRDGSPIITAGPCWPFCTFVTVPLIVVLSTLVMVFIVFNRKSGMVSCA